MPIPEADSSSHQPVIGRPRSSDSPYRGRFAPSPTGALHFGSLIAAVGSYLDARRSGGQWLLRIEDLDPPREVPGSAQQIVRTLESFGFEWDGPILYQSTRLEAYRTAAQQLMQLDQAYECSCSRAEIAAAVAVPTNTEEARYPGWCRRGPLHRQRSRALRLFVHDGAVDFVDRVHGTVSCNVAADSGDFVIRRRDGLFAYQLAVTVDDAAQGITDIVRGADLMSSTCRQILVQRALSLPTPTYLHLPLAVDKSGAKLSKSAGAGALDERQPACSLWHALEFLRQAPPAELLHEAWAGCKTAEIWSWGIRNWNPEPLRGIPSCSHL